MRNVPQTAKDLSAYRFERAKEDLESAHNTYDSENSEQQTIGRIMRFFTL